MNEMVGKETMTSLEIAEVTLRDRYWTCPECGARHHRDELAACNILRQGIAELESGRKTTCRPKTA